MNKYQTVTPEHEASSILLQFLAAGMSTKGDYDKYFRKPPTTARGRSRGTRRAMKADHEEQV